MEEKRFVTKVKENFRFFAGMSLLYGILTTFCIYNNPNGVTFPMLVLITIAFASCYVKKIGIPMQKDTYLYAGVMALLGISSFLTSNWFLIFFNRAGILLLFFVMMMHQFYQDREWGFQTYMKNIFLLIGATCKSMTSPFRHAVGQWSGKEGQKKKTAAYIFTGIGIAFVMLIVIFPLLLSSDRIFELYFGKWVNHMRFGTVFQIFMMILVTAVLCYAFFVALCRGSLKHAEGEKKEKYNPMIGITFTSVLAFVYLLYCGIQIVYLFIGRGNILPQGVTYASYARSGFWELLVVSLINFIVVLACTHLFEENRMLKVTLTLISACTFVMIFSSAYRMCMYIAVYHLTFLRVLVLWFLVLLTLIMSGTVIAVFRKHFPLFRYVMLVTACCYLLFSFAKPDYWIAKYNVAHMQTIEWSDLNYLIYGLSDDAAPVLAENDFAPLLEEGDRDALRGVLEEYFGRIRTNYKNNDVRTFNYSHMQALRAAEKYRLSEEHRNNSVSYQKEKGEIAEKFSVKERK